jgi:hypothetical protein
MRDTLCVVEGYVATDLDDTDLSSFHEAMGFALDQRHFGPRRLVVAFAEREGRFRGIAATKRTDPIEHALRACLLYMGDGAAAAVAFNDELIDWGPPPDDLANRFWLWRAMCRASGVHLVDWISCDDQLFRSTRLALEPEGAEWWDVLDE